ncbi:MAG TPA: polymer-forming cytoskeletal protein [Nitrospiraceae bacterium]|jgi:cytoskeletal protein CcmA (bactofilin family)|nr:polymer-forming cytoskeletal protein [Nitrospiraceae bacterium]
MWELNGKKPVPDRDENFTFLGRGVDFKGVIRFDGTVRIDGRMEGEVHTKGVLIVGEHAAIKGLVVAGTVICGGRVQATVTASEKVQLLKSAILIGDIRTPILSMDEGAHHHGMCEMGANKNMDQVEPVVEQPDNVHNLAIHRGKVRAQESS